LFDRWRDIWVSLLTDEVSRRASPSPPSTLRTDPVATLTNSHCHSPMTFTWCRCTIDYGASGQQTRNPSAVDGALFPDGEKQTFNVCELWLRPCFVRV
jgi:hypothetical protein